MATGHFFIAGLVNKMGMGMNEELRIGVLPQENTLWDLVAPTVASCELEIVRVKLIKRGGTVLEVLLDKPNGKINLDECAEASRRISRLLDVEEPIADAFNLEVSSPGVDRPLVSLASAQANIGNVVRAKLHQPIEDSRKIIGTLQSANETTVEIAVEGGANVNIEITNIRELVLRADEKELKEILKRGK